MLGMFFGFQWKDQNQQSQYVTSSCLVHLSQAYLKKVYYLSLRNKGQWCMYECVCVPFVELPKDIQ